MFVIFLLASLQNSCLIFFLVNENVFSVRVSVLFDGLVILMIEENFCPAGCCRIPDPDAEKPADW